MEKGTNPVFFLLEKGCVHSNKPWIGCMNLVNYIQSRGRARAKRSRFILMCEEGNEEHNNLVYDLKRREEESRKELQLMAGRDRLIEKEPEDFEMQFEARMYEFRVLETGAKATMNSSLNLLYDVSSF
jgi:endoribonuclease Dicer